MKYQISFSGGLGSGISALIAFEKGVDFNLIFADTLIEDEDLYRFNSDIARAVGKEIITLTDGRTPWDVFVDKRWIGNSRTAHCSTELKTKPVKAWLDANSDRIPSRASVARSPPLSPQYFDISRQVATVVSQSDFSSLEILSAFSKKPFNLSSPA